MHRIWLNAGAGRQTDALMGTRLFGLLEVAGREMRLRHRQKAQTETDSEEHEGK